MADLFTRSEVQFGGAFHSQKGIISSTQGNLGVLMQNLTLQYTQQVTRLYELGVTGLPINSYYVAGRSQGNIAAGHIIGPGVSLGAFYRTFSDVCQARCNNLRLDLGPNVCDAIEPFPGICTVFAPGTGKLAYTAKFCVLVAIGMSVSVADFVINENSTIMFTGLDFDDGVVVPAAPPIVGGGAIIAPGP